VPSRPLVIAGLPLVAQAGGRPAGLTSAALPPAGSSAGRLYCRPALLPAGSTAGRLYC